MLAFVATYLWAVVVVPTVCIICKPIQWIYPNRFNLDFCFQHFLYDVLAIQHTVVWNAPLIERGIVLANHRCALDLGIDCYLTKSSGIGRGMAYVASSCMALLILLEQRGIIMRRSVDKRDGIYARMVSHIETTDKKRICFWPEGTRNSYTTLSSPEEVGTYLKYGLLKSIYDDKRYPVQLCISSNKEIAFSEKKLVARRGVPIHTMISKPIHPVDFAVEQEFYDAIKREWFDCWVATHKPKAD